MMSLLEFELIACNPSSEASIQENFKVLKNLRNWQQIQKNANFNKDDGIQVL